MTHKILRKDAPSSDVLACKDDETCTAETAGDGSGSIKGEGFKTDETTVAAWDAELKVIAEAKKNFVDATSGAAEQTHSFVQDSAASGTRLHYKQSPDIAGGEHFNKNLKMGCYKDDVCDKNMKSALDTRDSNNEKPEDTAAQRSASTAEKAKLEKEITDLSLPQLQRTRRRAQRCQRCQVPWSAWTRRTVTSATRRRRFRRRLRWKWLPSSMTTAMVCARQALQVTSHHVRSFRRSLVTFSLPVGKSLALMKINQQNNKT